MKIYLYEEHFKRFHFKNIKLFQVLYGKSSEMQQLLYLQKNDVGDGVYWY